MLINALDPEESRIAVVEDGVLQELHVELANREGYLGNIYKGKVVNIEPSIGAAFVNFGGRSNGFLHVSDVLPAYGKESFTLLDLVEGRAHATGEDGPEAVRAALEDAGRGNGDDENDNGPPLQPDDDTATAPDRAEATEADEAGPSGNGDALVVEAGEGVVANDTKGAAETAVEVAKKPRRGQQARRGRRNDRSARAPRVPIEKLLKKGQEVVVQVTKEGIGAKGPTLTTYVSLPGRSLVLMPSLPKCGVSRKIDGDKERRRLKRIVRELDETGHGGLGFIVRTAGVDKTKEDLRRDRDYLHKIWELVAKRVSVTRAPAVLYQESDLVLKAMRDLFAPDIDEVVADSRDVYLRIKDFTEKLMPHMAERLRRHESTTPIFHSFGLEKEVQELYQPKIEMENGITLVVEQTEALVAIDVNSGRFKPGTNLEETAYRTNMEAAPEIARQLRLRDLGGVIICDFIDMTQEKHKRAVERKLIESLRGERARIKVGKVSPFGMLELTRQRVGPGLKRTVFNPCSHCGGAGLARTVASKALAVLRDVRALLQLKGFSIIQVFVAPPVNDYLVNHKRRAILDLEEAVGKSIVVKGEPSYPVDVVHFRFLTADNQEARVAVPPGLGVSV
ncbi:MAG: Rne/Rng family ribonuclease [Planctomycetota bacterium]|jgi:ribonuclease E